MKKILVIILISIIYSCKIKQISNEQIIFNRIEYIFNLKKEVEVKTWPTFNDKKYDLPLVYFTDSNSYIANPTEKFLNTFSSNLVFKNQLIKIYKTKKRVDSLPFHMETGMTMGKSIDEYDYHSPFMMCSG